jgi:hypothetical protein
VEFEVSKTELGQLIQLAEGVVDTTIPAAFASAYLKILGETPKNEEHPLVYFVRLQNRFSPESMPLLGALERFTGDGDFGSIRSTLDYQGMIEEVVKKPLDSADDYEPSVHHWRRSSLEERINRGIDRVRYKLQGQNAREEKAKTLASFYLQSALNLYAQRDDFMRMAVADVLHSRGEMYAKRAINFAWQHWARQKGYDPRGFHYPEGEFESTLEHDAFFRPPMAGLGFLSRIASQAWQRMGMKANNARDKRISHLISADREELSHLYPNMPGRVKLKDLDQVRGVLTNVGISLGENETLSVSNLWAKS